MSGHFGKRLFICAMLIAIAAATNYEELKQEVQLLKQNSAKTNSEMKQLQQNNVSNIINYNTTFNVKNYFIQNCKLQVYYVIFFLN